MDIEIRCVHYQGGLVTQRLQHLTLEFYPVYDRFMHRKRVRSPRITEPPYKHLITCLEVYNFNRTTVWHQFTQYIFKIRKEFPLADINAEGYLIYFSALLLPAPDRPLITTTRRLLNLILIVFYACLQKVSLTLSCTWQLSFSQFLSAVPSDIP